MSDQMAPEVPPLTQHHDSSFYYAATTPGDLPQHNPNSNFIVQHNQELPTPPYPQSAPPEFTPLSTQLAGTYRPDSNRGRKRSTREAPSHKAALNREAQRALRERKANYIKSLETQIAELSAINNALLSKQQTPTVLSPPPSTGPPQDSAVDSATSETLSAEIEALRIRNHDLELQLADATTSTKRQPQLHCITCNSERMKTMICIDQIKVLESQVGSLQRQISTLMAQQQQSSFTPHLLSCSSNSSSNNNSAGEYIFNLNSMLANEEVLLDFMYTPIDWHRQPPPSSSPPTSGANNMSVSSMSSLPSSSSSILLPTTKSSEQLFGPMEVETFRIILKQVTSLRRRPELVDGLFDLLLAQTKVTNVRDARRVLVQINRACFNVLEVIDRAEKSKYNELFAIFHERNAKHEIHFSELCAPPEEIKQQFAQRVLKPLPPHVFQFRNTLKCIPSLGTGEAGSMVDQFCNLWVYKEDIRGEGFYYYNYCLYELERLCTNVEDRSKFWEAYDAVWASDHANVEVLLDKVEHE
ncbi:hypothetical protein HDU83_002804 [Entophlyctis luteolus]|nr:hypothetical protein HDU83_002804 [Entophlyctis luteolus]